MPNKKQDDDDAKLFSESVKDVKPLRPPNVAPRPPRAASPGRGPRPAAGGQTESDSEDTFVRAGIQKAVLKELRSGRITLQDELDLHGFTVLEAEQELRAFLQNKQTRDGQRAVRVIHGKGRGSPNQKSVLKEKVQEWLRQSEAVLAFCPAGLEDGGSGALRVLLRRIGP
jgi:DNA-nicking Smr family endonuclease